MAMMQKDSGFGLLVHVPAYDKKSRQLSHHHNIFLAEVVVIVTANALFLFFLTEM
jgi:hypothetical protein